MRKKERHNTEKRNSGIDLLRLIAMLFVVLLHSLNQGGILKNVVEHSSSYKLAWLLEIIAFCAVDIFALISGFVSYSSEEKKQNYTNYVLLWLQVVFYGTIVTFLWNLINPALVSPKDYWINLFPVTNGLYWYFTAYTGLWILMPLLNKGIRNCNNKTMKKIFLTILFVFSILETITKQFHLENGYSFIWIMLLYILGATIKKCEIGKNLKNAQAIIAIFLCYMITYLYKMYGSDIIFFNIQITKDFFLSYTSPTMIGAAILYVILFSKLKVNPTLKRIISFAAPSAFAIYLLNNQIFIWDYVMKDLFVTMANQTAIKILVCSIGFSLGFGIFSILIDKIRIKLFKIGKVKNLAARIAYYINKVITKIVVRIE